MKHFIAAFYKFSALEASRLPEFQSALTELGREDGITGLMIIATEGVNATLSGEEGAMRSFLAKMEQLLGLSGIHYKESWAEKAPFKRFTVQIRDEIVTSEKPNFSLPTDRHALTPEEWQSVLESQDDYVVIDTRNKYETEIGKFRGAIDPEIDVFTEFPKFLSESQIPREKKVLIYCTGGIRCEKAIVDVLNAGFKDVYQLEGGILSYLEKFPDSNFEGECFVFDNRVAVDQHLQPSKKYSFCVHCGQAATNDVSCAHCGSSGKICNHCIDAGLRTCSKNCEYQINFQKERRARQQARRDATLVG